MIGLHRFVGKALVALVLENQVETAEQRRKRLRSSLGGLWEERWKKATNKKRRKPQEKAKQSGAPTSVHKVIAKVELEKQKQGSQSPSSCAQQEPRPTAPVNALAVNLRNSHVVTHRDP